MAIDFGAIPPEITSALMYAGPGSAPLVSAASAWNALATELSSAATGYETVLARLTGEEWLGPASAAMADAAAPYVAWMHSSAMQAEHTATQARSAAAAFEAALAATVPPAAIATNRLQLQSLLAANLFGQYTAAIASLEAEYGSMWAQDAGAMYGYAGQAAAATAVTPFSSPAPSTTATGGPAQAEAVTQAAATAAGNSGSTISQMISGVPTTLQSLASPTAAVASTPAPDLFWQILTGSPTAPTSLSGFLNSMQPYASVIYNTEGLPYFASGMGNNFIQASKTLGLIGGAAPAAAKAAEGAAAATAAGAPAVGGQLGGMGATAALGDGALAGKLSVPPSWTGSTPFAPPILKPMPVSTVSNVPEAAGAGNLLGGMPLAGAGAGAAGGGAGPRYGFRPTVMARPPFAG